MQLRAKARKLRDQGAGFPSAGLWFYHDVMKNRLAPALLAASLLLPANALAAPALTASEKRMVATVEANEARDLALLEKIVNQNSGSRNIAGVKAVAEMVRPEFEALGFTVKWLPMEQTGRAGHLVATHTGKAGAKRLLLIGHLDTVFEADSPFQTFKRNGSFATGPGVADDKGGLVAMLAALRAMAAAGTLGQANIVAYLTGDEEDAGDPQSAARADLIAEGRKADVALDFEGLARDVGPDGKLVDMGSIARRSAYSWTIEVTAKSGHSSGVFGADGDGAIYALARLLAAIRAEVPEPNLTLNVGMIAGGAEAALAADQAHASATGKTNIIPAKAIARGDLRTLSPEQNSRAQDKMAAIVARAYPRRERQNHVRGRLSANGPDRREPRPARPSQRRERRAWPPRHGRARSAQARRGRYQLRRGGCARPRRPRPRQQGRSHSGRNGRSRQPQPAGQARGPADEPPRRRQALGNWR